MPFAIVQGAPVTEVPKDLPQRTPLVRDERAFSLDHMFGF